MVAPIQPTFLNVPTDEYNRLIGLSIQALQIWQKLDAELPAIDGANLETIDSLYAELLTIKSEFSAPMCWGFRDVEFLFNFQDSGVPDCEDDIDQ